MEGLRQATSSCSPASPSCRRLSSMSLPSARLLCFSAHLSATRKLIHKEVCKHHMYVDNTQTKSKGNPAECLIRPRATATPAANEDQGPYSTETSPEVLSLSVPRWMDVFIRFSRPFAALASAMCITSASLLAVQSFQDLSLRFVVGLVQALIPALFMHLYMVGLNQIFDIEIDKINKPHLPLASGEMSMTTAIFIVSLSALLSFAMGVCIGSKPLLWGLSIVFFFANAYSIELPFLRWKRSAFGATFTIVSYRGIGMPLAYYLHMQCFIFGRAAVLTKPLIFSTIIMCCFFLVVSIFKDIPDFEGDQAFGMQSLPIRFGKKRVFQLCVYLLLAAYGFAALVGVTCEMIWARMIMVLGHSILAGSFCYRASQTDLKSKVSIDDFYVFMWKLLFAEYFLIPFMR